MNFTLNRDKVLTSTLGLSIDFKKGVPTHVPRELHQAALGIGATPGDDVDFDESKAPVVPQGDERKGAVLTAMEMLAERNDSSDFTATGVPTTDALKTVLGYKVDSKERDELWTEYQQSKSPT